MKRMLCGWLSAVTVLVTQSVNAGPWEPAAIAVDSSDAAFNTCYATLGNSGPNSGALIRISLTTGAGTLIGPTGILGQLGDTGVPALAIRASGEMYALDIGPSSKLYQLSAKTGAATLIAATGLDSPPAMVFDGFDVLNVVDANGNLHTLDASTGVPTLVGATGVVLKGLAVDPTDGWLWGSDASSRIYKIDGATAVATLVGPTGLAPSPDLCFNAAGVLFAASGGGVGLNNLISINKSTGAGTVIGPIGFPSVSGMATRLDHIVPTLVQAYWARWRESGIELRWRLTDASGNVGFAIDRAAGADGYRRIDAAGVSWDGTEFVFLDAAVWPGRTYRYRVAVLEGGAPVTSFEAIVAVPAMELVLEQNHPNPFRAATRIRFSSPEAARVRLTVHDVTGRLVRVLADRRVDPGSHFETWDGRDARGALAGSGVYFYRLRSGDRELTRRMMLID